MTANTLIFKVKKDGHVEFTVTKSSHGKYLRIHYHEWECAPIYNPYRTSMCEDWCRQEIALLVFAVAPQQYKDFLEWLEETDEKDTNII